MGKEVIAIFFAQYLYLAVIGAGLLYFLYSSRETKKQIFLFSFVVLLVSYTVAKIAGHFYYDPRPFVVQHFIPLIPHAPDNGFPSDHALLSASIASIFTFLGKRSFAVLLWTLTLLVGISRMYVGIHSLQDILGSIVLALLAGAFTYILLRSFRSKHSN